MKNINWKSYLTGLLSVGTLAFLGGIVDFQNIKAQVKKVSKEVNTLKSHDKKTDEIVRAVGIIVCMNATKEQMPREARETCKAVLK